LSLKNRQNEHFGVENESELFFPCLPQPVSQRPMTEGKFRTDHKDNL